MMANNPPVRIEIEPFCIPDKSFDPFAAGPEELAKFGIPERPDEGKYGRLHQFWSFIMWRPVTFEKPEPEVGPVGDWTTGVSPELRVERRSRWHTSPNWSGAYINPKPTGLVTDVVGAWVVPDVTLPAVPPASQQDGPVDYRSSVWIGIDGQRPIPNTSLPQIGTEQSIYNKTKGGAVKRIKLWVQWWINSESAGVYHVPVGIANFGVREGDLIAAWVRVRHPVEIKRNSKVQKKNGQDAYFFVRNFRTQVCMAFKVSHPEHPILTVGRSAEWVVERPTSVENKAYMYPLPNYGTVQFQNCLALTAEGSNEAVLQDLESAQFIRMTDHFSGPHRSSLISKPDPGAVSKTSFSVAYVEAHR